MRKVIMAAVLLFCLHSPARADSPVIPPSGPNLRLDHATVQFVGVYNAYAQAIKDHGVQGLKEFTTSDFALPEQDRTLTGEKAYKEFSVYLDHLHNTLFTVLVRPLAVNGNNATALMGETYKTQINNRTVTLTWYWKQTWRKTARGWKLATSRRDERDFDKMQGLTMTFMPQAKDATAAERGRMNP